MKTSRSTKTQFLAILRQAEGAVPVAELCQVHALATRRFANGVQNTAGWIIQWSARRRQLKKRTFA